MHSSRCARAPLAFACLARKSRVHALLRARVCQVCVYRVPQRIAADEEGEGEGEGEREIRAISFREMILAPVICSLSRSLSRRRPSERIAGRIRPIPGYDRSRINYAARFIERGAAVRSVLARAELRYFYEVPATENRFPVASSPTSNLSETRERKFGRQLSAL